ncbi:MAG: hypothetical protein ACFHX7_23645 [Pseudomonadota bacterium]
MRKLGLQAFTGKSGREYVMNAYPGDMRFNDFIPGVYVISAADGNTLLVGESDNVDVALQKHAQREVFADTGHRVFFYRNASKSVRESTVADLVATLAPSLN